MAKTVWMITQYASPPQYETRARNNSLSKYMIRDGYDVVIFGSSFIHNTNINLIDDGSLFKLKKYGPLKYVLVNAPEYSGNGIRRIWNMLVYPHNLFKVIKKLKKKPDIIINDLDAVSFSAPYKIASFYNCPMITEVRDLWPESIVSYGYLKEKSIIAKILYSEELKLYKKSDCIVYSMEGWYDYIEKKKWTKYIPKSKSLYINNGVDLELFNANKENNHYDDRDLDNKDNFNIVYVGAIRKANNLGKLLDVAKSIDDKRIKFLIWGDGDELAELKSRVVHDGINNVTFKGFVDKKYIPSIVSRSDLNIVHSSVSSVLQYGLSLNKMFDYLAAGKPILFDFHCKYNPAVNSNAAIDVRSFSVDLVKEKIMHLSKMNTEEYKTLCDSATLQAHIFDYKELAKKMESKIDELTRK